MKQKLYYLLALAGVICLDHQIGYALRPKVQMPLSVTDTTRQLSKVTVVVKDLGSSKLLDSVRVTLGKEAKYTVKGTVVFENNTDSVIVLSKPGYSRTGKRIASPSVLVRMMKAEESVGGYFVNTALSQNTIGLFSGSAATVTGEELHKVSSLSLVDGLKFFIPSLYVNRNNNQGSDPNALPQISLRGVAGFPLSAGFINNSSVFSGLQVLPSKADYVAANLTSGSGPLILLDGIQVSAQTILDIDLNRVKNVVVLKDAVATASYGMRGSNGVIAVQTNKPQGKFEISFSEQLQVAKQTNNN